MHNYLTLTRVLLKTSLGSFSSSSKKGKSGGKSQIILYGFVLLCMIPAIVMIYSMVYNMYDSFAAIGQGGMLIELICYADGVATLLFGAAMIMSVFYMTNDIQSLLPLPLKPWQIVGSKFTVALIYEYLTELLLIGPALVAYGVASGAGVTYWLFAVFTLLTLPVIPMVYISVVIMLFMRIFKGAKNKDLLNMLGTGLTLIAVLLISTMSGSLSNVSPDAMVEMLMEGNNSLIGVLSGIFPTFRYLSQALVFADWVSLLIYILSLAIMLLLFLVIAQEIYLPGVIGMNETGAKRKRLTGKERSKMLQSSSPFAACLSKEWKLLMRTPIYLLNCALMVLIWPFFLIFPMVIALFTNGVFKDMEPGFWSTMLNEMKDALANDTSVAVVLLIAFGLTVFCSGFSYVAGTSISREGSSLFVMKYLPVSYRTQLSAKVCCGSLVCIMGILGYGVIILILMTALFGFPIWALLLCIVLSITVIIFSNLVQLAIDLMAPKLNWESETQAVKQNFNVMFESLISIVVCAGLGFLGFILYKNFDLSALLVGVVGCLVFILIDVIAYQIVMRYGERRILDLE